MNIVPLVSFPHPPGQRICTGPEYEKYKGKIKPEEIPVFYPSEMTTDSIKMKRYFDELIMGQKKLAAFEIKKNFYAVPQLYTNKTSLGMWTSLGSRYGVSERRATQFAPHLENEYSLGPFSYQHYISTGAAPLKMLIHEEPQTHFFYSFKADYFRFGLFVDPSKMLLGNKYYRWEDGEIAVGDDLVLEDTFVMFGVDFKKISLQIISGSGLWGVHDFATYNVYKVDFLRYGLVYENHLLKLSFWTGDDKSSKADYELDTSLDTGIVSNSFTRFNAEYFLQKNWTAGFSYISPTGYKNITL